MANILQITLFIGYFEMCFLIDGTIRHTPVAEVEFDTSFYKGKVKAVCMENL